MSIEYSLLLPSDSKEHMLKFIGRQVDKMDPKLLVEPPGKASRQPSLCLLSLCWRFLFWDVQTKPAEFGMVPFVAIIWTKSVQ